MSTHALSQSQSQSYPSPVLMPPPEGQAYGLVRDNLNAPSFETGSVLPKERVVSARSPIYSSAIAGLTTRECQ
jgi:hypothetical protein